jgi:lambda repressor-like predicted transcriptional regulator
MERALIRAVLHHEGWKMYQERRKRGLASIHGLRQRRWWHTAESTRQDESLLVGYDTPRAL